MPHINKYVDFVVEALIVHKDKILLTHHLKTGEWIPIGGHIEPDEDPITALLREVKEESGLTDIKFISKVKYPKIKADRKNWWFRFIEVPYFMDFHKAGGVHKHMDLRYIAVSKTDKVKHQEEESGGLKWFTKKDLDDPQYNLMSLVKYYAKEALRIVKENGK